MSSTLYTNFKQFIEAERLLTAGQSVVLAVSGGVDSMVMLRLFGLLRPDWKLRLCVAHFNHRLRGKESDEDEQFVRTSAERSSLEFFIGRADTLDLAHALGVSKQTAARDLRYRFFERVRRRCSADAVATAHHADDNAETVLMNIVRGTGLRGLSGIPVRREPGGIIRPLLFARRDRIAEFAAANGVAYREDSSNSSSAYDRNVIRRTILPALESRRRASVSNALGTVSEDMRRIVETIDAELQARWPGLVDGDQRGQFRINIWRLRRLHPVFRDEAILRLLREAGIEPSAEKLEAVVRLTKSQTGRTLHLSGGHTMYRDRNRLILEKADTAPLTSTLVEPGNDYAYPTFTFSIGRPEPAGVDVRTHVRGVEFVDAARIGRTLSLRPWRRGDRFVPLGMRNKKKLSDFFSDAKVPRPVKRTIPILESDGEIVWVCGQRLDERFKVTSSTRSVVRLTFQPVPEGT